MLPPQLQVLNVSKFYKYGGRTLEILREISFNTHSGSILSILGPPTCGKSTLCRVISGLEKPSSGEILFEGKQLHQVPMKISLTLHGNDIFPWLTVRENVEFGLSIKKFPKSVRNAKVDLWLREFELEPYEHCYPKDLPQSFQYRVSLARALAVDPSILVLDDPFRSLDESSSDQLRKFLEKLHTNTNKTLIVATSNISEGLKLADKLIVLTPIPSTVKIKAELPPKPDRDEWGLSHLHDSILKLIEESMVKADEALYDSLIYDDLKNCFIDLWEDTRRTIKAVSGDYRKGLEIIRRIESAEAQKEEEK